MRKIIHEHIKTRYKIRNIASPVKASIAFAICSVMQKGIAALTTPVFTRLLTTEEFGYYSLFNSWQSIISIFSTLCLNGSIVTQAMVKFDENRDRYISSIIGLGTLTTCICVTIYLLFRETINHFLGLNTIMTLCVFISSLASLIFTLWARNQRIKYLYKSLVIVTILTSLAKPIFGVIGILLFPNYRAEARIVSLVLVEVVVYGMLLLIILSRSRILFDKFYWGYSAKLSLLSIPHYLMKNLLMQSDRIMIHAMIGMAETGIYSLAHSIAFFMSLVNTAILDSFNPWFYQQMRKENYSVIQKVSYVLLIVCGVANLLLVGFAPEIVRFFAPPEYEEAILAIPPLIASVFFIFMYSMFANIEFYFEKPNFLSTASIIGGVLNVLLNYYFIKNYGYIAAGYTTLFCYICFVVLHYTFSLKLLRKQKVGTGIYNTWGIVGISAAFLALCFFTLWLYDIYQLRWLLMNIIIIILFVNKKKLICYINMMK